MQSFHGNFVKFPILYYVLYYVLYYASRESVICTVPSIKGQLILWRENQMLYYVEFTQIFVLCYVRTYVYCTMQQIP